VNWPQAKRRWPGPLVRTQFGTSHRRSGTKFRSPVYLKACVTHQFHPLAAKLPIKYKGIPSISSEIEIFIPKVLMICYTIGYRIIIEKKRERGEF